MGEARASWFAAAPGLCYPGGANGRRASPFSPGTAPRPATPMKSPKPHGPLTIWVDRLTGDPRPETLDPDAAWWGAAVDAVSELAGADRPSFHFETRAHRMGADVYVDGMISGEVELGCSRCLARYRQRLREPFRLVLEPAGDRVPADPEAAAALARDGVCLADELETGWFRGREFDLGAFFLEVVTLALPVQPLCREECAGLCPRCGVDRNLESCRCHEEPVSRPFAALARLRGGKTEGEH